MTSDELRVVWLFGRPYWWDHGGRCLTLRPARWLRDRLPPRYAA